MIYYDHLNLSEEILKALAELNIDYVFQPIFESDGKTIYAREALMRPKEMSVTELIDVYTENDELHTLEIATFFGAMQAYQLRGYTEKIAINSFPCESMSASEGKVFDDYFGDVKGKLIVELLEYPRFSLNHWIEKRDVVIDKNNIVSLDDYGTGINDMDRVIFMQPGIVKLDRSLISDVDKDVYKQANVKEVIDMLHLMNKIVVAEGVETKEEFEYLKELGADLFQGYYLARPA